MPWQVGGSVAAILLLAGIARCLRLGESRIAGEDTARRFAEDALVGFVAGHALVGTDGNAAIVAGNNSLALLKRHGTQVAARRLIPPVHVREAVEGAAIDTGERSFGPVTLFGITTDQVHRLQTPGRGDHDAALTRV